jgi:hypothetical protein
MLHDSRRFARLLVYAVALVLALRAFVGAAPQEGRELRGRVVLRGEPVAGATVRLLERRREPPHEERDHGDELVEGELFTSLAPRGTTTSARDGTFRLDGVPDGEMRLELDGPDGARAALDPLHVSRFSIDDLRDVELSPGGALEGRVLLPPDTDPRTVELACAPAGNASCTPSRSSWGSWRVAADVREDGTFRFEGVPRGRRMCRCPRPRARRECRRKESTSSRARPRASTSTCGPTSR